VKGGGKGSFVTEGGGGKTTNWERRWPALVRVNETSKSDFDSPGGDVISINLAEKGPGAQREKNMGKHRKGSMR